MDIRERKKDNSVSERGSMLLETKVMEFVIYFAMLQSPRARRKFTAHADRIAKGRGAVALLSIWYPSRKEIFWGSSGQHAAAQHSQCGGW